jgi:hypothetical protein
MSKTLTIVCLLGVFLVFGKTANASDWGKASQDLGQGARILGGASDVAGGIDYFSHGAQSCFITTVDQSASMQSIANGGPFTIYGPPLLVLSLVVLAGTKRRIDACDPN